MYSMIRNRRMSEKDWGGGGGMESIAASVLGLVDLWRAETASSSDQPTLLLDRGSPPRLFRETWRPPRAMVKPPEPEM